MTGRASLRRGRRISSSEEEDEVAEARGEEVVVALG